MKNYQPFRRSRLTTTSVPVAQFILLGDVPTGVVRRLEYGTIRCRQVSVHQSRVVRMEPVMPGSLVVVNALLGVAPELVVGGVQVLW
jgi:hypothetical protein